MLSLEQLYKEVDNLRGLVHPLWKCGFRYMTDAEAVALAEDMTTCIAMSERRCVLVSETGAAPLAEICKQLAQRKSLPLRFIPVKFPRDPLANIYPALASFLTAQELAEPIKLCSHFESLPRGEALARLSAKLPPDFFETGKADIIQLLDSLSAHSPGDSLSRTQFQRAASQLFEHTQIARLLTEPFVYLDEYIDSGTTFRNALAFLRCLNPELDAKVASYYMRPAAAKVHERVLFIRCTADDRPQCFESGAYPYENRIDLIGHLYRLTDSEFVRTEVAAIAAHPTNRMREHRSALEIAHSAKPSSALAPGSEYSAALSDQDGPKEQHQNLHKHSETLAKLLGAIEDFARSHSLHEYLLGQFAQEEVQKYITTEHIARHIIHILEAETGDADTAEFLFQMFDMYGPAWTPMPVAFHFDFWNGFARMNEKYLEIPAYTEMRNSYRQNREVLLRQTAKICLTRRQLWLDRISELVEERHGDGTKTLDGRAGVGSGVDSGQSH